MEHEELFVCGEFAVIETENEIRVEDSVNVICRMGYSPDEKNGEGVEREAQIEQAKIIVAALHEAYQTLETAS